jgi:hypothetical protein
MLGNLFLELSDGVYFLSIDRKYDVPRFNARKSGSTRRNAGMNINSSNPFQL